MIYCINPYCPKPVDAVNANNLICRNCGSVPNKEMRQIVIYLRKTNSQLVSENSFKLNKTYHQFEVIRLWEQPTDRFMSIPGLLPFAVLSQTNDPTMVLTQVAKAVEAISHRQLQRNIAAASGILAGLVLNKNVN